MRPMVSLAPGLTGLDAEENGSRMSDAEEAFVEDVGGERTESEEAVEAFEKVRVRLTETPRELSGELAWEILKAIDDGPDTEVSILR